MDVITDGFVITRISLSDSMIMRYRWFRAGTIFVDQDWVHIWGSRQRVRKLIAFDDDTFDKLTQLARDRMATFQELADEAFADLLRKHGIPIDLKDALRKSVSLSKTPPQNNARSSPSRKRRS
jgi:hypothetical protein